MKTQIAPEAETQLEAPPSPDNELRAKLVKKAAKTRFEGQVTYWQGTSIQGVARAENLGHGDISLRLNRFVAPGDTLHLRLDCLTYRGVPIHMDVEIACCRRVYDERCFLAIAQIMATQHDKHRSPGTAAL